MGDRILEQQIEHFPDDFVSLPHPHGLVHAVGQFDQLTVLVVDGSDTHAVLLIPGEKSHDLSFRRTGGKAN
jgi:hypothetical protein